MLFLLHHLGYSVTSGHFSSPSKIGLLNKKTDILLNFRGLTLISVLTGQPSDAVSKYRLFCSSELVGGAPRAAGLKGKVFQSPYNSLGCYLQLFSLLKHTQLYGTYCTCTCDLW